MSRRRGRPTLADGRTEPLINRTGRRTPDDEDVRPGTRWRLIAFAVLTAPAVNQLLVFAEVADRFWAWAIPTELTAAFLGAA